MCIINEGNELGSQGFCRALSDLQMGFGILRCCEGIAFKPTKSKVPREQEDLYFSLDSWTSTGDFCFEDGSWYHQLAEREREVQALWKGAVRLHQREFALVGSYQKHGLIPHCASLWVRRA